MLKLRKIAVTGGLAAGKSLVCRLFEEEGAYCCSADEIAHRLIASDPYCKTQLLHLFGPEIAINGSIQRDKIARIVFSDKNKLKSLENLIHPLILNQIELAYSAAAKGSYSAFVAEVPLLFEAGWESYFDETIAVIASEKSCIERSLAKGHSLEDYHKRASAQLPASQKAKKATHVIRNDDGIDPVREAVQLILDRGNNGKR